MHVGVSECVWECSVIEKEANDYKLLDDYVANNTQHIVARIQHA